VLHLGAHVPRVVVELCESAGHIVHVARAVQYPLHYDTNKCMHLDGELSQRKHIQICQSNPTTQSILICCHALSLLASVGLPAARSQRGVPISAGKLARAEPTPPAERWALPGRPVWRVLHEGRLVRGAGGRRLGTDCLIGRRPLEYH
jgi:hypothetical protein